MIDANGGGSFANIDRRSGFSVPSSHQSVKQTTSQEANIRPANEAEQTKSAGADSWANATVQIRQRSYVSSLWQGVLDRPSNGSREAGSQAGLTQTAAKPEETGLAAIKAQAPSPIVKPQASSVAAEAQATTAEASKADFLPTIPQYIEDSIPAPRAQLHGSQQSPKVTSAQPSSATTAQPTHTSAQSNPVVTRPNHRTSAQLRDATLAKVLASPVSSVKAGVDHGSVSATSAAASGAVSTPTNVGSAQHKAKLDRQAIMQQAAIVRQQAKERAEAQARQLLASRQPEKYAEYVLRASSDESNRTSTGSQPVSTPTKVAQAMSVNGGSTADSRSASIDNQADGAGAAAVARSDNAFSRLAGAKVTLSFNLNKKRFFNFLRYATVALIIVASGYLAWDTYTTNRSVKSSLNGNSATAMSISGTNPATAEQTAVSQEQRAAYTVPADQPRYIYIPTLGVNARVMSVGVNSRGSIDTPSNLNDTAWYDGSAKPGQEGQVFIDGHTSFNRHLNAAFNNLPKLKANDQVVIEKGNGEKVSYRVVSTKTVETSKVDMGEALNPPAGAKKGLTLMTCTGTFNYRNQTADKRFIVYAVQE
ncbi:MAG: class F sortase [Candidatus Nanoperiomorbus sp.]